MKKICLLTMATLLSVGVFTNCNNLPPDGDKDFDGLINKIDPDPNNNQYQVRLKLDEEKQSKDMNLMVDYREFIKDGYNKNLSLLASFIINNISSSDPIFMNNVYKPSLDEKIPIYGQIGCQNIEYVTLERPSEDPYDIAGIYLGHHIFTDENNNKHQVFFIGIRPYVNHGEQWVSNFDLGAAKDGTITEGYKEFWDEDQANHTDWKNYQHHKGFDVTANRLVEPINDYIAKYEDKSAQKVLIITGHSRGASIANILAKLYVDNGVNVRAYCFNSAMVTKDDNNLEKYKNIFVLNNENDLISRVPCPNYWGFKNYGKVFNINVQTECKDLYDDIYGTPYSGCTDAFLDVIEMMFADLSVIEKPTSRNAEFDSNNVYEKWHYPDAFSVYDYEYFESEDAANQFIEFTNQHCPNSVEITGPTYVVGEGYLCKWKNKGALLINFLNDILANEDTDSITNYLILLNRLLLETISELISAGALISPSEIIDRIKLAHAQPIACILAMCANDQM